MKESEFVSRSERIRFVLVRPTHPGNIGGVARAMKTMGLRSLSLVDPPPTFPGEQAIRRAAGAADVLEGAQVCSTLDEAIGPCGLVVGTSARTRSIDWPTLLPTEAVKELVRDAAHGQVAVLFGQERSGLDNREVERCRYLVAIPTAPHFTSLNLASAAQIMAYELFLGLSEATDGKPSALGADNCADQETMRRFYRHLESVLLDIDFPNVRPPVKLMRKLVRLFNRAALSEEEVSILRGILSEIQAVAGKKI